MSHKFPWENSEVLLKHPTKVLFVSRDITKDCTGGSSTYRLALLRYLKNAGCNIQYIFLGYENPPGSDYKPYTPKELLRIANVRSMSYTKQNISLSAWNDIPSPFEIKYFKKYLKHFKPDVVIVDRVWLAGILDEIPKQSPAMKVILTHDVAHQRIHDFCAAGLIPFKKTANQMQSYWNEENESAHLRKAQIILAIQESDLSKFQDMAPYTQVLHMPIAIKPKYHKKDTQINGRCLFVGGSASHNLDGLLWFLNEIWPLIIKKIPTAHLHVCGNICEELFPKKYPNVTLLGHLGNLNSEYATTQVCVIPLRVGSGLKIKLIEALAHGRACVSTSIGVQGMNNILSSGVSIADSPKHFALEVCKLIENQESRQRASEQSSEYMLTNLAPNKIYGSFLQQIQHKLH